MLPYARWTSRTNRRWQANRHADPLYDRLRTVQLQAAVSAGASFGLSLLRVSKP
jgi:hypothetical protein